jgi:hypothetical protein
MLGDSRPQYQYLTLLAWFVTFVLNWTKLSDTNLHI